MELYYRRSNGILETVVIFMPDLSTILPSTQEWKEISQAYKLALFGPEPEPAEVVEKKEESKSSDTDKKADEEFREDKASPDLPPSDSKLENLDTTQEMDTTETSLTVSEDSSTLKTEVADIIKALFHSFTMNCIVKNYLRKSKFIFSSCCLLLPLL